MSHIPYYGEEPQHTPHTKENKMSNETPFTIRLSLLKMAKEMLDREYEAASQTYFMSLEQFAKSYNKSLEHMLESTNSIQPKMYTPEAIVEKAKELYKFVSTPK